MYDGPLPATSAGWPLYHEEVWGSQRPSYSFTFRVVQIFLKEFDWLTIRRNTRVGWRDQKFTN